MAVVCQACGGEREGREGRQPKEDWTRVAMSETDVQLDTG